MKEQELLTLKATCLRFLQTRFAEDVPAMVFGEGNVDPALVLIGEAPGEKEALYGHPFVGKAGKNLDAFLEALQLNRPDIYITNVVKFRPTAVSAAGRIINRTPTKAEILEWSPYLIEEIRILSPQLLVTLGNTPLHALAGFDKTIGQVHGTLIRAQNGRSLFPLYHPASIIYNQKLKETYAEDLVKLSQVLHVGIGS